MFQIFQDLYRVLVFEPELNILYGFFQLTGDIGPSIILLALAVNLVLFPLFAKNYINLQKTRILQPQIKAIQDKYKDDPQKMLVEVRKFNKEHGVSSGSTFLVLIVQLVFISGLYLLIRDVIEDGAVAGLYSIFWGDGVTTADFVNGGESLQAFGFIPVNAAAREYIWIPLTSVLLSYLYGMYTFRWSPKLDIPKPKQKKKKKKEEESALDPEAMRKTMEVQSIYVMPIFLFIIQYNLPIGLNIYFVTSSAVSLIRQIILTRYYQRHTRDLIERIVKSDPTTQDNDPSNDAPEITALEDTLEETNQTPKAKKKTSGKSKKSKGKGKK
jgi:YidC/Oxa1 family membrane protein insertase